MPAQAGISRLQAFERIVLDPRPRGDDGEKAKSRRKGTAALPLRQLQLNAPAGSVILFDSRLWHCVAVNNSDEPRYAMNIGYAPWWLNLEPQRVGSADHTMMVVEPGGKPNQTPRIPESVYDALPDTVKPFFRHMLAA